MSARAVSSSPRGVDGLESHVQYVWQDLEVDKAMSPTSGWANTLRRVEPLLTMGTWSSWFDNATLTAVVEKLAGHGRPLEPSAVAEKYGPRVKKPKMPAKARYLR